MPDRRQEVINKVTSLVETVFAGSYRDAFNLYSGGSDSVTVPQLLKLLRDAGVGNFFTENLYAEGILKALDTNHNRLISWDEFFSIFNGDH